MCVGGVGGQKPDLQGGKGVEATVSQWVMLLLLLKIDFLSRSEGDLETGSCSLAPLSSFALGVLPHYELQ